jgi:hypothetical protein
MDKFKESSWIDFGNARYASKDANHLFVLTDAYFLIYNVVDLKLEKAFSTIKPSKGLISREFAVSDDGKSIAVKIDATNIVVLTDWASEPETALDIKEKKQSTNRVIIKVDVDFGNIGLSSDGTKIYVETYDGDGFGNGIKTIDIVGKKVVKERLFNTLPKLSLLSRAYTKFIGNDEVLIFAGGPDALYLTYNINTDQIIHNFFYDGPRQSFSRTLSNLDLITDYHTGEYSKDGEKLYTILKESDYKKDLEVFRIPTFTNGFIVSNASENGQEFHIFNGVGLEKVITLPNQTTKVLKAFNYDVSPDGKYLFLNNRADGLLEIWSLY